MDIRHVPSNLKADDRKFIEVIYESRDRLTRIEAKLDRMDKMESKVEVIEAKTSATEQKAQESLLLGKQNSKEIAMVTATLKWGFGTLISLITVFLVIIGFFLKG